MSHTRKILATAALAFAFVAGCADSTRHVAVHHQGNQHLLFNPSWTGLPTVNSPRQGWPSTVRYKSGGEVFEYRETIIDIENSFGSLSDRYYRRFHAVRSGHGHR